jgi:DNA-binding transcriptional MerR regulator
VDKAPEAFRTISEVAEEIDVPQHVLRFWESRFGQIRPMKRGGGRRYYRPDDIDLLRGVRHLLYGEGYTIRGVQRILREQGIGFVQDVWRGDAELPAPSDDDGIGDDEVEATGAESVRAEPSRVGTPSARGEASGRREPTIMPPTAAAASPRRGLSEDERGKLKGALAELIACRGTIDAALSQDFSEEGNGRSAEI